jgi:HEPN domain-containing protein
MNSWWRLGEGIGQLGNTLALYQIECAFCGERGNWELEHRAEKKQPNGGKVLFFDTYKCGSCASYVMVLWSASEDYRKAVYTNRTLHDYHILPWPLGVGDGSKNWPAPIPRFWKQAHNALNSGDYDSAAIMTRSALQAVTRQQKAKKGTLKSEIEDLASKGILPPVITDWSHEVRELGNPVAHPDIPDDEEEDRPTEPQDAEDIVEFMDYLLRYVYDIPAQIVEYRARHKPPEVNEESEETPEATPGIDDRLDI